MIIKLPDDYWIEAPIEFMQVKDCVFIPTLQPELSMKMIKKISKDLGYLLIITEAVHDDFIGILVRRIA